MGRNKLDLLGQRFGRLVVIDEASNTPAGQARWLCDCDCGNQTIVATQKLRIDHGTRSCGCLKRELIFPKGRKLGQEANLRHGHATRLNGITPTYRSWRAMIARCTNPNAKAFKNYGGRGITVCERWKGFDLFLADMGERPKDKTLDRINSDGNYEPSNCHWATRAEQNINQRHPGYTGPRSAEWRANLSRITSARPKDKQGRLLKKE